MTLHVPEDVPGWWADRSLIALMGNAAPPRDPNDDGDEDDDENDEDRQDDEPPVVREPDE